MNIWATTLRGECDVEASVWISNLYSHVRYNTPEMYILEAMCNTMKSTIYLKEAEIHPSIDKYLFIMTTRHKE